MAEGKEIERLDISHTAITDRGLGLLAQLKSLEELELQGTHCTDAAVTEFRKRRPYIEVRR